MRLDNTVISNNITDIGLNSLRKYPTKLTCKRTVFMNANFCKRVSLKQPQCSKRDRLNIRAKTTSLFSKVRPQILMENFGFHTISMSGKLIEIVLCIKMVLKSNWIKRFLKNSIFHLFERQRNFVKKIWVEPFLLKLSLNLLHKACVL